MYNTSISSEEGLPCRQVAITHAIGNSLNITVNSWKYIHVHIKFIRLLILLEANFTIFRQFYLVFYRIKFSTARIYIRHKKPVQHIYRDADLFSRLKQSLASAFQSLARLISLILFPVRILQYIRGQQKNSFGQFSIIGLILESPCVHNRKTDQVISTANVHVQKTHGPRSSITPPAKDCDLYQRTIDWVTHTYESIK